MSFEIDEEFGIAALKPNEQLNLLRSILESSTEFAIIILDKHNKIVVWNEGAHKIYGYTSKEILGKQMTLLFMAKELTEKLIIQYATDNSNQYHHTHEMQCIRKNGQTFNAAIQVNMRYDDLHQIAGYTLLAYDLTESKKGEALLNQLKFSEKLLHNQNKKLENYAHQVMMTSKLKSDFLANVSHELRTPLNGIIGFTQLIYDGIIDKNSAKFTDTINDIMTSAKQLLSLINDVLDITKIESGKMVFHPVKIDLKLLLEEVREMFLLACIEKNINLTITLSEGLQYLVIDQNRLKQVLYNFISNALKFSPLGGTVNVRVLQNESQTFCIEVEDFGIGIHEANIGKLFKKFEQLDAGLSKSYQGSGLGLALTKEIVEAQGGRVGVKSKLGKGSLFYAVLPYVQIIK